MSETRSTLLTLVIVAAVALGPVVGVVSVPAAAAGSTSVSVSPGSGDASVGDTVTFDIVVDTADGGVGAWEGTLSLTDGSVGNITGVRQHSSRANGTVRIAEDNNSVYFDAFGANTSNTGAVTIATVTVSATGDGLTDLNLTMDAVGDESGASYTINSVNDGELAVGTVATYSDLTLNKTTGTAPFTVEAAANVTNVGGEAGTITVPLTVDGTEAQTKEVSLEAGASKTVSFTYEFTVSGRHNVSIGTLNATTVAVNGAPSASLAANTSAVNVSEPVRLNASASTDPDGDDLTYAWDLDEDGSYDDENGSVVEYRFDAPGSYNVSVRVDDGNATDTATVTITVSDVTPPEAAFVVDADGDGVDDADQPIELGQQLTLNGSDSTDNAGIASYDWRVVGPTASTDDPTATLTGENVTFEPKSVGSYNVTLTVADSSQNTNATTRTVEITDTTPPNVALDGPAQPIINVTTTFSAANTTDNGDVVRYYWDFDGDGVNETSTTEATAGYEYTEANQTYNVTVTAVDQSDNTNSTTLSVETSRAPAIEISSPTNGAYTSEDVVNLVYVTDNLDAGDAAGVEYRVDGGEWQQAPSTSDGAVGIDGLSEGNHTITVRLVNSDGNRLLPDISATTASVNFTVDRTAPQLSLQSPEAGDVPYGTTLEFGISDANFANATYRFTYANGTTSANRSLTSPYAIPTDGVPEGVTDVTIVATDKAGNTQSTTYTFDFVSKPDIADLAPNGTVVGTESPTVTANFSDDDVAGDLGVNASAVTLAVDGEPVGLSDGDVTNTSLSTVISPQLNTPGNETVELTLTVVDEAGHATTRNATFIVDSLAPSATLDRSITKRVSTNHPVEFTVSSEDVRPEATWVNVTQNGQTVRSYDVTSNVAAGGTTVVWNGTDANGDAVSNGVYNVTIRSVDTVGNVRTRTKTVKVDNEPPTVNVDTIESGGTTISPPDGSLYVDGSLSVSGTSNGTPGEASAVTVTVNATFTNFEATKTVTPSSGAWATTFDAEKLPDEGNYTVEVQATDPANNVENVSTGTTVTVDRTAPNLGARVNRENGTAARINLTVSEPIDRESLSVSVVLGNGTTQTVDMTETGDGYTGTFPLSDTGKRYNVTAVASDPAGNEGTDTANAIIVTESTTNKTVTVKSNRTGTFVRFNTSAEVENTFITLTESDTPLRPLSSDLVGASFLNGELGAKLTADLVNATIGIPVSSASLPSGISPEDVTIRRYNETTGTWNKVNTTVENVTLADGTNGTYWVATVDGFSTYGAVVEDNDAPELSINSPTGNLDYGETDANVRFEYGDALSDINTSAITLYFDGKEVTGSSAASITGSYATYNATGLETGETYNATVNVVDEAGNDKNYSTTFTVVEDTAAPTIDSISPTDGAALPATTDSVTLNVSYGDDVSGVDTDSVQVYFDGTDVTEDADIGSTGLSYTATGLMENSSHTLRVVVVDNAGNGPTERTVSFRIDESSTQTGTGGSGGGGGGGGGDSGSSATVSYTAFEDSVTISVREAAIGDTVTQRVADTITSERTTLERITVEMQFANSNYRLEVGRPTQTPQNAPELGGATALDYIQINSVGLPTSDIDRVQFAFSVSASALPDGASMDDVVLYRYNDGSWKQLETTHQGDGQFVATSPGFSTFAIGVADEEAGTESGTATDTATEAVTETSTATETEAAGTGTAEDVSTQITFPGFGALVALLALLASALLFRRE